MIVRVSSAYVYVLDRDEIPLALAILTITYAMGKFYMFGLLCINAY